jgi:single-stranded DNA-specific DHH superfamily exonuclease
MVEAVQLLWDVLQQQGRILIISDFDADGATSCALVLRALRQMGFQHLDYIVPDRFIYGYGLSPEIAKLAVARQPDLIITVDNGISSIEGVARVRASDIKVLITDHHLPGDLLPEANAIVNPNQKGCQFASKALAGVGVAFYLMMGLRAWLRDQNWFAAQGLAEPRLVDLLDLVARVGIECIDDGDLVLRSGKRDDQRVVGDNAAALVDLHASGEKHNDESNVAEPGGDVRVAQHIPDSQSCGEGLSDGGGSVFDGVCFVHMCVSFSLVVSPVWGWLFHNY